MTGPTPADPDAFKPWPSMDNRTEGRRRPRPAGSLHQSPRWCEDCGDMIDPKRAGRKATLCRKCTNRRRAKAGSADG